MLHLFDQKYKNNNIVTFYYKYHIIILLLYYNIRPVNSCDGKAAIKQSSVSHDLSEIILIWWFAAQETIFIVINVETWYIFVQNYLI